MGGLSRLARIVPLKDWGKSRDLTFIPEYEYQTLTKTRVYTDAGQRDAIDQRAG